MKCPNCNNIQENEIECSSCGIIFSKYLQRKEELAAQSEAPKNPSGGRFNTWVFIGLALVAGAAFGKLYWGGTPEKPMPESVGNLSREAELAPVKSAPSPVVSEDTAKVRTPGLIDDIRKNWSAATPLERARNSTVFIKTPWGSGSGFFVDDKGHIVSNRHVVKFDNEELNNLIAKAEELGANLEDERKNLAYYRDVLDSVSDMEMRARYRRQVEAREESYQKYLAVHAEMLAQIDAIREASQKQDIKVYLIDGQEFSVGQIVLSERLDLALLSIYSENTPHIPGVDAPLSFRQGQKVYTVGNPSGLKHTVTSGIISGYRKLEGHNVIQTDAPINPGNSGGPLIDEEGRLLGVNTMIMKDTEGIGFAIPVDEVYKEFSFYISE